MTPNEFNDILTDMIEEARLEHKLYMCGTWSVNFDVVTGKATWRQLPCNDYRICPVCLDSKIIDWERAFEDIEEIFLVPVKEENWKATTRQWKKEGRVWYQAPVERGRIAYFDTRYTGSERRVRKDFFSGPTGTRATLDNAHLLTIGDILVQMPKDRRVGGKLVRLSPPKKEREEGAERVEIEVVSPEKGKEGQAVLAIRAAIRQTAHLDPHDAMEVETAYATRMAVLKVELQKRSIRVVSSHTEYRYVKSDAIEWRKEHHATVLHKQEQATTSSFVFALERAKQQEMTLR